MAAILAPRMLAERLTSQLLAGESARHPVAVTERLLAVQAQDERGARLAVRARTTGVVAADVDRALTEERSLVVDWLNRGTLHMVRTEDYWWLHMLTTPPLRTANARRLTQEGVTEAAAEKGVAVIERALTEDGPLSRPELRERLRAAGVRTEGQAFIHILALAALRGIVVRGPMIAGRHACAHTQDWIGPAKAPARDAALAELARRYLAGHGPSSDRDLARWAGIPLRDARAGLSAIAGELQARPDGLIDLVDRPAPVEYHAPRLLGAYEPVLLGWRSREEILGEHEPRVVSGGLFRPFALVRGKAVATWRLSQGEIDLSPFGDMTAEEAEALQADGAAVLAYLGA